MMKRTSPTTRTATRLERIASTARPISTRPRPRLVAGPASATAASPRGVDARTSIVAGEPMKWTEIASTGMPFRRPTRACASS